MRMKAAEEFTPIATSNVLHRNPHERYPLAVSASGVRLTDAAGRTYLDMSGGAAVSCLGHGHPDIVRAVQRQIETLAYAHTAFFTNEPQEQLARMLTDRFGDDGARVYFLSGGSEANETALKIAWQYWAAQGKQDKKIVVSREHSYHGNTLGTLSVSGNAGRRQTSAAPLIEWPRIPPCYEYRERRNDESTEAFATRSAEHLEAVIREYGNEHIAAFIAEPVVGSSLGVVPAVPGYFERIRDICTRNEILLIADEVMCGSGRTGRYFAHEHDGIKPDIVSLAKGIAGGYQSLGAVIASSQIASTFTDRSFAHGHTYIGHATACAAGVAVQEVIDRDDLLARTHHLGAILAEMLNDAFEHHPHVGDIRCRGLFAGIELVSDRNTKAGFEDGRNLADRLRLTALEQGLICYPASITVDGKTVPHILLAPPMVAEVRHLEEAISKVASTINACI